MNFMHDMYRLSYIKRYSNIPKIHEESVAEHGFFVAAIVMALDEDYDFDLGDALKIAISHDMPEMELNDCPHIIKSKYPEIKAAFDKCEKEVAEKLPQACKKGVLDFDKKCSVESLIVELADAIQCIQFSKVEVDLGNVGYMKVVYDNSVYRVNKLKEVLAKHESERKSDRNYTGEKKSCIR